MQDDENTKEQLIDELIELRLRVAEFETAETRAIGSENALQRSEYGYRTLFERARDSIMIIGLEGDRRGQIVAANPVAAEMHGYNLEEILTLKISDLDTPESAEKLSERIDRILKGEWLKEEATHRRKDGSVFPIEISACVLELGNEKYALAIDRDITERKRAQEELRESEEKFAKVFRYAPVLITLSNVDDGTYLEVNDKFSEVSGFSRAEAIGKTSVDLGWISPEDRKRLIEELQAHGSVRGMDLKLLTKDKREIHIIYNGELIKTKNRQVLLSIAHDITERKRAEQELRKFKSISDRANYGCAMVDLRGFLTYVNEAFANMHGFSSPELIGKNLSVFHTDEQMEHVIRLIEKLHRDGEFEFQEVWHAKKDGTVFPTLMGAAVIKDDEGTPIFLSATAIDITDRKQAEQDRENLRSQLLQSQKMATMGTLAGGIAHDFNNMLAIILGFSDMLLADKNEGDPEYEELQKIVKTSRDAADLVQRIRIFGRRAEMVLVPLDLNHQVDEVTKLLASTLPKTIDIDIHLTKDPVIIKADASQITQMVMNLAVNANEAMPQGGRLSIQTENILLDNDYCRVHVGVKPGPHVMLTVSDTGRGIDKGLMERIFDPFYSSKAETTEKEQVLGCQSYKESCSSTVVT